MLIEKHAYYARKQFKWDVAEWLWSLIANNLPLPSVGSNLTRSAEFIQLMNLSSWQKVAVSTRVCVRVSKSARRGTARDRPPPILVGKSPYDLRCWYDFKNNKQTKHNMQADNVNCGRNS